MHKVCKRECFGGFNFKSNNKWEKGRKGEREKGRKGEREKGRKGEREKGRKGEREKGRQTQRQAETDKQIDWPVRKTSTETDKE
jgi:hypothetical protein